MKLTKEQEEIILSSGNIKINAVAGSGKTTTIIEYARTRPVNSRILYLAFNKSVKLEAIKKFQEKGLRNVTVETAHSLAYKQIVFRNKYVVKNLGYQIHELVETLKLEATQEKHVEYVIANHILKFMSYYCNSDKQKITDLNYPDTISEPKALSFVLSFYDYILKQTIAFWHLMESGEIEITHDFYLKKFQLSNPTLPYDFILFDEGQDASAAMLDVFLKQKATKVIVGDTHQQIYGWRFAVNSLEKAKFKTYYLSTSFRFSQDIANLAAGVLQFKSHIGPYIPFPISGIGENQQVKSKAILARTNLGLLLHAIEYVVENESVKHIYFEGNFNSYTYADEGASLYDVLNLHNGKRYLIKDGLIKSMTNLKELENYIAKTEDLQLGMMVKIVHEYGNKISDIIKTIKQKHVENNERDKAEMIFSTVHRCKGMEYDDVQLVNDFMTEEKLKKLTDTKNREQFSFMKLNEEINLLYVAVTRTRNEIKIPEILMPKEFPESDRITVSHSMVEEETLPETIAAVPDYQTEKQEIEKFSSEKEELQKAYSVDEIRKTHREAYMPWTDQSDLELTTLFCQKIRVNAIAEHFGRTKGAIRSRIKKLELRELYP